VIIGKNRNGPIGVANLIFQKSCVRFVDGGAIPIEVIYKDVDNKETKISMPPI